MDELKILFQSSEFTVVDKPAGISVHNNEDPENLLMVLEKQLQVKKLFPVHRLDKETSGVQVLALKESSARDLAEEFQGRSLMKMYNGIMRGQLKQNQGIWKHALTDKSEGRKNPMGLSKDRIPCETRFRSVNTSKYFTLCEFGLITGRQHQIRKHAALANHAIVGDPRYGEPNYNKKMAGFYKTGRMFLHCLKIELLGQVFESSLPKEFEQLLGDAVTPNSLDFR